MLIAFAGLPCTGKSTLARALAQHLAATYLRIDTIERVLAPPGAEIGPEGYLVAYALAEDNLRVGQIVVADSVNALAITREAWRRVADSAGATLIEIEIVCSDPAEHRRRIEQRGAPTWPQVCERHCDPWDQPHIVLDTAGRSVAESSADLVQAVAGHAAARTGPG